MRDMRRNILATAVVLSHGAGAAPAATLRFITLTARLRRRVLHHHDSGRLERKTDQNLVQGKKRRQAGVDVQCAPAAALIRTDHAQQRFQLAGAGARLGGTVNLNLSCL